MIIGLTKSLWDGNKTYAYMAVAFPNRVVDNPFPFRNVETGGIFIMGSDAEWGHHEKDSYNVLGESEGIGSSLTGIMGLSSRVIERIPQMRRPEDSDFRVFGIGPQVNEVALTAEEIESFKMQLSRAGYVLRV